MAVQVHDQGFGINGHQKSLAIARRAHIENSNALINHAEGKDVDTPRPVYDPDDPDNQWPVMVHHPSNGEKTIGVTLKGVEDTMARSRITAANKKALTEALAAGYRAEPYIKPQVAVLDPATEKAELLRKNNEMQGQLNTLHDLVSKLTVAQAEKK